MKSLHCAQSFKTTSAVREGGWKEWVRSELETPRTENEVFSNVWNSGLSQGGSIVLRSPPCSGDLQRL